MKRFYLNLKYKILRFMIVNLGGLLRYLGELSSPSPPNVA